MPKCKDCVHWEACREYVTRLAAARGVDLDATELEQIFDSDDCDQFHDRSRFVELPIIDDYEETKLLDKAIDYCYKVAMSSNPNIRVEYKAEHMRLCGWLGDLRRRIEAEQALKELES